MTYFSKPAVRRAAMLACASTLTLGVAACKIDNRPLLARHAPEPAYAALPAPGPLELAFAPASGVAPLDQPYEAYGWAERAYGLDRAFYQAEPDYGFSYGEVEPWAWESPDDWTMYAEPIDDGYRFYYYEPEAEYPYFVRDADYGYGYNDDGLLVALFTVAGVLLPTTYLYDNADVAGRYYYRGEALRQAALREEHRRIDDDYWRARAPVLVAAQTPWIQAAVRQDDWRTYRTRTDERDLRRFEPERARRAARIDRAIQPDVRTVAIQQDRQDRRDERSFARAERQQDRQARRELRETQARAERPRQDIQHVARAERQQAREAARQQDRMEAGRRQDMARAAETRQREARGRQARDQAQEAARQQRQVEAGRRAEMQAARATEAQQRAERGRQRQQEQQARHEDHGSRQAAPAAPDHGQKAAAQPQERGGGGKGGGDGGGKGKGGGKKD